MDAVVDALRWWGPVTVREYEIAREHVVFAALAAMRRRPRPPLGRSDGRGNCAHA
ncbi:hypothetical protein [Nocardia sp. NPDC004711]